MILLCSRDLWTVAPEWLVSFHGCFGQWLRKWKIPFFILSSFQFCWCHIVFLLLALKDEPVFGNTVLRGWSLEREEEEETVRLQPWIYSLCAGCSAWERWLGHRAGLLGSEEISSELCCMEEKDWARERILERLTKGGLWLKAHSSLLFWVKRELWGDPCPAGTLTVKRSRRNWCSSLLLLWIPFELKCLASVILNSHTPNRILPGTSLDIP